MRKLKLLFISGLAVWGAAIIFPESVMAQAASGGDVQQINTFIKSIVQVIAGLAGLLATGFFVLGGLSYITSSGNPMALQKAKRTIIFAGLGLAITIAAFALTDMVLTGADERCLCTFTRPGFRDPGI